MRILFRSRPLLCVIFLTLNIGIQFALLSLTELWVPTLDPLRAPSSTCQCPNSHQSDEPKMCAGPSPVSEEIVSVSETHKDDTHYLLFVLVLSSVYGLERRNVARETWMQGYKRTKHPVMVKFAVGTQGLLPEDVTNLKSEQTTYGDLLLLPDMQEDYANLTRKVLFSFTRIVHQFDFSYLLKCDDDSYILLDTFVEELYARDSPKSLYWGFFDGRAHVKTRGKWSENNWFLCDRYLPYALGGGYVLSYDLVRRITTAGDSLELYNSEDVSVGVWLSPYKAERQHDVRFNTEFVSRGCRNSYIVSHKQSIEDMRSKFKNIHNSGHQCDKEYQTRLSYQYNWNHPPTKCCVRREGVP